MEVRVPVERWPYNRLERFAVGFLAQHHPSGEIPIPIEEIIDLKMGIDILPINGLSALGSESSVSRDMKTIYIDGDIYRHQNSNRYRSTLAHELSHVLLHRDVFESASYNDIDGYKKFVESISEDDRGWIENQAYNLSGLLLVPSDSLEECYAEVADTLAANGMDIRKLAPDGMKHVGKVFGQRFRVSSKIIHKRAVKLNLWSDDAVAD